MRRLLLLLAVCGLLASASAGGGGGSGAEHSFLTTPTFVLATMFAFFLVCTLLFQHGTHKLIHYFHKLKRDGLAVRPPARPGLALGVSRSSSKGPPWPTLEPDCLRRMRWSTWSRN